MKRWRTDGVMRRGLFAAALAALRRRRLAACSARRIAQRRRARSFSREGLARVGDYIRNEIATGKIPGAILLIQQHGKPVYFENFGVRDVATELPMTHDTIFRLYSMSKPITSVAAMMLVEDGKLTLDDPVSKYIPAFADVKGRRREARRRRQADAGRGAARAPDHDQGSAASHLGPDLRLLWRSDRCASSMPTPLCSAAISTNAEFAERIAKLPLAEQPGTRWDYGHSTDVLGRVIEVVSGKSLFQFEKERLLDPLGMTETAFYVSRRGKAAADRRADAERPRDQPGHQVRDPMAPRRLGVRRRRHGRHHRRLCALRADAAEWRHASRASATSSPRPSR